MEKIEKEIKKLLKQTLKNLIKDIKGDLDQYVGDIANDMARFIGYQANGDTSKANACRRHLRAQALSLASITTTREGNRLKDIWWQILLLVAKTGIAILKAA
jgi:hypothetical protein